MPDATNLFRPAPIVVPDNRNHLIVLVQENYLYTAVQDVGRHPDHFAQNTDEIHRLTKNFKPGGFYVLEDIYGIRNVSREPFSQARLEEIKRSTAAYKNVYLTTQVNGSLLTTSRIAASEPEVQYPRWF